MTQSISDKPAIVPGKAIGGIVAAAAGTCLVAMSVAHVEGITQLSQTSQLDGGGFVSAVCYFAAGLVVGQGSVVKALDAADERGVALWQKFRNSAMGRTAVAVLQKPMASYVPMGLAYTGASFGLGHAFGKMPLSEVGPVEVASFLGAGLLVLSVNAVVEKLKKDYQEPDMLTQLRAKPRRGFGR